MSDACMADNVEQEDPIAAMMDGRLRPVEGAPGRREAYLHSPSVQNHAASLMTLGDGALGCVWFGGTQEGMADISVHMARLEPGADVWSPAVKLTDDPTRSEQNPILFPTPQGPLWLLYTSQKSGNQDTAVVRRRISLDHGRTWSAPDTLISDAGVFVRQPLVALPNGDWLLGTFLCRTTPGVKWVGDDDISVLRISSDEGRTWRPVEVPDSLGSVHMNVVPVGSGELLALYRSRWADHIHASRSADGGRSWSRPEPTSLPNNNSSIQATRLRDGRLALAYNHASASDATDRRLSLYDEIEDEADGAAAPAPQPARARSAFWGAPRAPLSLAFSGDSGRTWGGRIDLATGDGYCMTNNSAERLNRELSYPSVHQAPDGRLHVAFTHHRRAIRHIVLEAI
jgi:predicted neuraminidase